MKEFGKILKSTGKWYKVELADGSVVDCRIRGKLRLEGLRTTNPLAVGDHVLLGSLIDEEGKRIIEDFEPRINYIVRKSTNLSKQKQILAANIDRAYLMITIHSPETHLNFIDRFLVSAESFRIPVSILINKIDLCDTNQYDYAEALCTLYSGVGYPCHLISTKNPDSIAFLKEELKGKQVMISGHSGVGKSTLINELEPGLSLKTNEISRAHLQGQHTTTFAEMHRLSAGGYIIDTPGIRAFGLVEIDKTVLSHYFPEMRSRMAACKFHNCQHLKEPHCAIKQAVESGEIFESRYLSYKQMMLEDENEVHRKNQHQ